MNYKLMLRMLGRTLQVEALCLIIPMLVALYYREDPPLPLHHSSGGHSGYLAGPARSNAEFFSQEGFTVVGAYLAVLLPVWGPPLLVFRGSSPPLPTASLRAPPALPPPAAPFCRTLSPLPRSILFWRAFSSWVGGMGVLIFTMAFLPKVGGRSQMLFRAEVPGPVSTKLVPQTAHASQILYLMYFVLTGAEFIALRIAGMPWFDAITTTFSCVCTGGFSVMNQSLGAYNLPACEVIAIVFMFAGVAELCLLLPGDHWPGPAGARADELKFFLGAVVVVSPAGVWEHPPPL